MKIFIKKWFLSVMVLLVAILGVAVLVHYQNTPKLIIKKENKTAEQLYKEMLATYHFKEVTDDNRKTVCVTATANDERYCVITFFDENKNKTKKISCLADLQTDTCKENGVEEIYDKKGNLIKERNCEEYDNNNKCLHWDIGGKDYKYDENNNRIWERYCMAADKEGRCMWLDEHNYYHIYEEGYDYTYDEKNRKTSQKKCAYHYYADGACAEYDKLTEYTYDNQDHLIKVQSCGSYWFRYGKKLQVQHDNQEYCEMIGGNGTCDGYPGDKNADREIFCSDTCAVFEDGTKRKCEISDFQEIYIYNPQGFLIEKRNKDGHEKYLRDEKGNILVTQTLVGPSVRAVEYQYDEHNRLVKQGTCGEKMCPDWDKMHVDYGCYTAALKEDGHCESFKEVTTYTYNDEGNLIHEETCDYGACYGEECKLTEEEYCKKYGSRTDYTYDSNNQSVNQTNFHYGSTHVVSYNSNNDVIRMRRLQDGQYVGIGLDLDDLANFGYDNVYDKNGRIISERRCAQVNADGSCRRAVGGKDYIYDSTGDLFKVLVVDPYGKAVFDGSGAPDWLYGGL